jgi:endoglucanase
MNNAWSANFIPQGSLYLVRPEPWAQVIQPNQTFQAGYCANKRGPNYRPTQISVTGS